MLPTRTASAAALLSVDVCYAVSFSVRTGQAAKQIYFLIQTPLHAVVWSLGWVSVSRAHYTLVETIRRLSYARSTCQKSLCVLMHRTQGTLSDNTNMVTAEDTVADAVL